MRNRWFCCEGCHVNSIKLLPVNCGFLARLLWPPHSAPIGFGCGGRRNKGGMPVEHIRRINTHASRHPRHRKHFQRFRHGIWKQWRCIGRIATQIVLHEDMWQSGWALGVRIRRYVHGTHGRRPKRWKTEVSWSETIEQFVTTQWTRERARTHTHI